MDRRTGGTGTAARAPTAISGERRATAHRWGTDGRSPTTAEPTLGEDVAEGAGERRSGGWFEEPTRDETRFLIAVETHPEHRTVEDVRQTGGRFDHRANLVAEPTERGTHPRAGFQRTR